MIIIITTTITTTIRLDSCRCRRGHLPHAHHLAVRVRTSAVCCIRQGVGCQRPAGRYIIVVIVATQILIKINVRLLYLFPFVIIVLLSLLALVGLISSHLISCLLLPSDVIEWTRRMKDSLGVDVPSDAKGPLQDIHWSLGALG